jgi:hypothetical protein
VAFGAAQIGIIVLGGLAAAVSAYSFKGFGSRSDHLAALADSFTVSMESFRGRMAGMREQAQALATQDSVRLDSVAKGLPEVQQELFVLFNASGISDLYPAYVAGGDISCVIDGERCRTYARAMDRLLELQMAPSSDGFNLYLAARMDRLLGDNRKADLYLDRLKATRPMMFEFLTRYDDSFDITKLRRARGGQGHD